MTTTGADALLEAEPRPRHERLTVRVRQLRTRGGEGGNDRWLLIVGGILLPLGLLLVLLGWRGASRTVLLFEQIPYLVSGGLVGLSLVIAGGFVYFSYWQTLLVREGRSEREDLLASLGRLEGLLERALLAQAPTADASPGTGPARPLVATANGSMLHRLDCAAVAGRDNLREVDPDTPGLVPCRICEPLAGD